jgi:2-keto-4-pentenoate hydratase/2-oxohepta-3-ene-1,7-dioic acid hydratase in catechol pathway
MHEDTAFPVKLCMFSPTDRDLERGWPGRIEGDRVIQLAAQTLQAFFTGGGQAREHAVYPLAEVRMRPPVLHPPSVRTFTRGYDFHFSNPASIYGHEDEIRVPVDSDGLDYELGVAAIIGSHESIGGFTIVNDWAARGLEGAKSRDFALSLGPIVVTPDEFEGTDAVVVARVNGEAHSRGSVELPHSWEELRDYAGGNTRLLPGDVLTLALMRDGPVRPGDRVELEVEGIGVLSNRVA